MVTWNNSTRKYYENLGYSFTRYGDKFEVSIKDLTHRSTTKVIAQCDYCGKQYEIQYNIYNDHRIKWPTDCCTKCRGLKYKESTYESRKNNAFKKLQQICDKNNLILLTKPEEYIDAYMDIELLCPKHGVQIHSYNDIISSNCTCTQCRFDKMSQERLFSQKYLKQYIEDTSGGILLNPEDYVGIHESTLQIQCICGNTYTTSFHSYKGGQIRCSFCSHSISNGEKIIRDILDKNHINYIPEYKFDDCRDVRPLPFDFYLYDYNLCIEFQGSQHYRKEFSEEAFIMTQKHDRIKYDYCRNKCINLLIIPYWERDNIEQIILNKLDEIGKRHDLVS